MHPCDRGQPIGIVTWLPLPFPFLFDSFCLFSFLCVCVANLSFVLCIVAMFHLVSSDAFIRAWASQVNLTSEDLNSLVVGSPRTVSTGRLCVCEVICIFYLVAFCVCLRL